MTRKMCAQTRQAGSLGTKDNWERPGIPVLVRTGPLGSPSQHITPSLEEIRPQCGALLSNQQKCDDSEQTLNSWYSRWDWHAPVMINSNRNCPNTRSTSLQWATAYAWQNRFAYIIWYTTAQISLLWVFKSISFVISLSEPWKLHLLPVSIPSWYHTLSSLSTNCDVKW